MERCGPVSLQPASSRQPFISISNRGAQYSTVIGPGITQQCGIAVSFQYRSNSEQIRIQISEFIGVAVGSEGGRGLATLSSGKISYLGRKEIHGRIEL